MKVLIYPRGDNPYQELLYKELRKNEAVTYTYIDPTSVNIVLFPLILAVKRVQGYKILHLHWLTFQTNIIKIYGKQLSYVLTFWSLAWLKILKYKVVWTVHNVLPHEQLTSNDKALARFLAKNASAKIVHSKFTINQMDHLGLDTSNTVIIPIGSYNTLYIDKISPADAREKLDINKNEFVILFFGTVRPYKGIDNLIEVLGKLNLPHVRLLIAGKCYDEKLAQQIREGIKSIKADLYNQFIPDNEVSMYFRACDIVCLPFKEVTTSSSILLAMSFSKPVIAPKVGTMADMPNNVAIFYDPLRKNALEIAIKEAVTGSVNLRKIGKAGYDYSTTLSWRSIAGRTYKVYELILNPKAK